MNIRLTEKSDGGSTSKNVDEVPSADTLEDGSTVHLTTWDIDVTYIAEGGRWRRADYLSVEPDRRRFFVHVEFNHVHYSHDNIVADTPEAAARIALDAHADNQNLSGAKVTVADDLATCRYHVDQNEAYTLTEGR